MLSDAGASTLVIEAGTNTQYDLGVEYYILVLSCFLIFEWHFSYIS